MQQQHQATAKFGTKRAALAAAGGGCGHIGSYKVRLQADPARCRQEHAEQSVPGPSGPGPLPDVSWELHLHQPHRHAPPSQRDRCEPTPETVSKVRWQRSHTNLPSSFIIGGPVAPERCRQEHAEQSVPGPSGPGPFPEVSSELQLHQPHRHAPPSHRRLCTPSAEKVSKVRLQVSHGYLTCVACFPLEVPRASLSSVVGQTG